MPKKNSLLELRPDIAKELHPTKNGGLQACDISVGSAKKLWWICNKKHEWLTSPNKRTYGHGSYCPYCSGQRAISGENDLATMRSDLAAEWHPTKNGNLKPSDLLCKSGKKVWWQCSEGHEWAASVQSRTEGSICPYCAGRKVLAGYNDFETLHPDLAKNWHPFKNGNLKPSLVMSRSATKAWFQCKNGHDWFTSLDTYTSTNGRCPVCAGNRLIVGVNDLATLRPALAKEWNYEKNGNLTPQNITVGSNKKVWWRCEHGHEWLATVSSRTSQGCGCPKCSGRDVIPGENDLETLCPEIAAQWHPTKNNNLTPSDVKAHSDIPVWWQCEHGHVWKCAVGKRTAAHGTGCPVCAGRKVLAGFNDLACLRPDLAAQWHPTKNGTLQPSQVTKWSNRKVWWVCEAGHEWQSAVNNRSKGNGCPYCAGKVVLPGMTDLATLRPDLACELHPTKNHGITADCLSLYSNRNMWWQCEHGHAWRESVNYRSSYNTCCPICKQRVHTSGRERTI